MTVYPGETQKLYGTNKFISVIDSNIEQTRTDYGISKGPSQLLAPKSNSPPPSYLASVQPNTNHFG